MVSISPFYKRRNQDRSAGGAGKNPAKVPQEGLGVESHLLHLGGLLNPLTGRDPRTNAHGFSAVEEKRKCGV